MNRIAVPFLIALFVGFGAAPVIAAPVVVVAQDGCSCKGMCPCHAQGWADRCQYCPGGGGSSRVELPSTAVEKEPVRIRISGEGAIDYAAVVKALDKVKGLENAKADAGLVTFEYTGRLEDLAGIERSLSSGKRTAVLVAPAMVQMSLTGAREADPAAMMEALKKTEGVRLPVVTRKEATVYADLDKVCPCKLAEDLRAGGFEPQLKSHADLRVALGGEGDADALKAALGSMPGVVRAAVDGGEVHMLATLKVKSKDVQRAVKEAGFTVEKIEGR